MQFSVVSGDLAKQKTGCAILGIDQSKKLSATAKRIDRLYKGMITQALKNGDFSNKTASTVVLRNPGKAGPARIVLVGCGKITEFRQLKASRKVIKSALAAVLKTGATDAICHFSDDKVEPKLLARALAETSGELIYSAGHLKSKKPPKPKLRKLGLASDADKTSINSGFRTGQAIAAGVALARELGDLPSNVCTPTYLAQQARDMAQRYKSLSCSVMGKSALEKKGFRCFLSVAAGSHEPPQFITLKHLGGKQGERPVVLVGKGITFDTGGISLKPGPGMDEMKFDMCGAAGVLGTMLSVAKLKLKKNIIALVPTCSNMPGGNATNPGDIIETLSGQTVEILNTDAEGRLIMCDALTYAEEFKPEVTIDVATLTGACVIALGHTNTGLMTPHDDLANSLLMAGTRAADTAWRLPLDPEYGEGLRSNFADFANIGTSSAGGACTAASFLSRFAKKQNWAHLDIAGTAWQSGRGKGATGRPVPMLSEFLMGLADDS